MTTPEVTQIATQKTAPAFHGRWDIIVANLLALGVMYGVFAYSFALWASAWIETFNAPVGLVMLAITGTLVILGVVLPSLGSIVDKGSIPHLVTGGVLLVATGLFLISLASQFWQILLVHFAVFPIGVGLVYIGGNAMIVRRFSTKRGLAMGVSTTGPAIGGLVAPLIIAYLIPIIGWRFTEMVIAGFLAFIIAPLVFWLFRRATAAPSYTPALSGAPSPQTPKLDQGRSWSVREILTSTIFWAIIIATAPILFITQAIQHNIGSYGADIAVAPQQIALILSLYAATNIIGKLASGAAADKVQPKYLVWAAGALAAIGTIGILLVQTFAGLAFFSIFISIASGAMAPMAPVLTALYFGSKSFGKITGWIGAFTMIGAVGPFIAGVFRDLTGGYAIFFIVAICILAPSALIAALLPDRTS